MDKQAINRKIDNYIEIRKNLWTAVIVISSGLAGLLLSLGNLKLDITSFLKLILFITGTVLDIFLMNNIASSNTEIGKLVNKLEQGD